MNIILSEYTKKNQYNAGSKAKSDVIQIARQLGYQHIPLYRSGAPKNKVVFDIIKGCAYSVWHIKKNERILLQYPYYPSIVNKVLFIIVGIGKKIKGYKATLVIHDVMGLRSSKLSSDEGKIVLKEEIESMMIFDEIICHNEKMLECFKECFSSSKYKVLGPFDYLYEGNPVEYKKKLPWTIIVAGNLVQEKSGYLYNLPELTSAVFELYGNGYSQKISNSKNIIYNGGFPENELIKHLQGHFGLVWDGNSCETNEGIYGRYLRYNNPHKFSLYLAAGIPIIIWSESALVDCVKENNLGISISSLYELDDVLEKMTFSKYSEMRESVLKYREEIIKGGHLKRILTSLS